MRFCVGIVLYYPTEDEILKIKKKETHFEKVIIFDNTIYEKEEEKPEFKSRAYKYISKNKNVGLSTAYNTMCKWAYSNGYDYLLLLDQDSVFTSVNIKEMKKFIKDFDYEKGKTVGIFAPKIIFEHKNEKESTNHFEKKKWVISSGSFINLNVYNETDGFDEFLFIDRVDEDYCKMLTLKGYDIIQNNYVSLSQTLGDTSSVFKKKISEHNPFRVYHMSRNRMYIYNKYYPFPIDILLSVGLTVRHILVISCLESQKKRKIKALIHGIKDFYTYKLTKEKNI